MKQEQLLLEQITLSEEILDKGPGEGRGVRLAALVLRLNEHISEGKDLPLSWRPPAPVPAEVVHGASLEEMMRAIDDAWQDDTVYLDEGDYELIECDMPQCVHGWGWDGVGQNTCPQCNTPEALKAHAASTERFTAVRKLRSWADSIEQGSRMARVNDDDSRVKVLRDAAASLEAGEENPAWAR